MWFDAFTTDKIVVSLLSVNLSRLHPTRVLVIIQSRGGITPTKHQVSTQANHDVI